MNRLWREAAGLQVRRQVVVIGHRPEPRGQQIAAVQIAAQGDVARAAQLQKVVHVAADRVQVRLPVLGKKIAEEVDAGEAARLTEGLELRVGEMP